MGLGVSGSCFHSRNFPTSYTYLCVILDIIQKLSSTIFAPMFCRLIRFVRPRPGAIPELTVSEKFTLLKVYVPEKKTYQLHEIPGGGGTSL